MLLSIEDDHGSLAKQFQSQRFGTKANLVAAATTMFTTNWSVGGLARDYFLGSTRNPGSAGGPSSPAAAVRATEINGVAQWFADAIATAMTWTFR